AYIGMIKLACTFIWLLRNYFCAQNLLLSISPVTPLPMIT
ncbi:IS5 family transposase, partial [Francisella tularensis subsp. holarctica]